MSTQPAATENTRAPKPGFARRNARTLAAAALLAAVALAAGTTWTAQHAELDRQEQRITGLDRQRATAQREKSARADQDLLNALGLSQSRMDRDSATITALVKTAFTWDSGPAYEQARTALKKRWGLAENSGFLTSFMPPATYNEDASGKRYYYIDARGLTSTVSGVPDIAIVRAAAGDYTYAALLDVENAPAPQARDDAGRRRAAADRRILLTVTVGPDRHVSHLAGTPASGPTRHSK